MAAQSKPKDTKDGAPRSTVMTARILVAGAMVAVGSLIWGIYSYFMPKPEPSTSIPSGSATAVSQQATASRSGTAINAARQAQVAVGASPQASVTAASMPQLAASQSAQAGDGGTAINATDSAGVTVTRGIGKKP